MLLINSLNSSARDSRVVNNVCHLATIRCDVPFKMSATPLDTNRSPGETSRPGRLTTTELRLLSCNLKKSKPAGVFRFGVHTLTHSSAR